MIGKVMCYKSIYVLDWWWCLVKLVKMCLFNGLICNMSRYFGSCVVFFRGWKVFKNEKKKFVLDCLVCLFFFLVFLFCFVV